METQLSATTTQDKHGNIDTKNIKFSPFTIDDMISETTDRLCGNQDPYRVPDSYKGIEPDQCSIHVCNVGVQIVPTCKMTVNHMHIP